MNFKKSFTFIFLLIILIFHFSIYNAKYDIYKDGDNYKNANINHELDLTISPIFIDDLDPSRSWSYTSSQFSWCSGSGTLMDPYIIENIEIDALRNGSGIEILNSHVYFIIRNCVISNSGLLGGDAGIKLSYVSNGIINSCISSNNLVGIHLRFSSNLTIFDAISNQNKKWGIKLDFSNNNTLRGTVNNNNGGMGIFLDDSANNKIIQNIAINNGWDGYHICDSPSVFLYGNIASNHKTYGILLIDSNNARIINNNLSSNGGGISLSHSNYNIIEGNIIQDCTWFGIRSYLLSSHNRIYDNIITENPQGIYLSNSDSNRVFSNNISMNDYGVFLEGTYDGRNNVLYKNRFIKNQINGWDEFGGYANKWDNGSIGNYWDDYMGEDSDFDGIGDSPYTLPPPNELAEDKYPIWDNSLIIPPNIIIISPEFNELFGSNPPDININIRSMYLINTTWYSVDAGLTNYTFFGSTFTINQTAWNNLTDGKVILRVYANDTKGNIGYRDRIIQKDASTPRIFINWPVPNQLCGVNAPSFSLTIDEANIQTKCYSINGRPNITFTGETQFNALEWDTAGNGTVSIAFYVIDKAGNVNSSEIIVRKDAYIPDITIYAPLQDDIFTSNPPGFNISIVEEELVSTWYTIEGIAGTFPISELTGFIDEDAWSDAPEGDINITFFALDSAGNIGIKNVSVIKSIPSTPLPSIPAISGYNMYLIIGMVCITSIILFKKLRNLISEIKKED